MKSGTNTISRRARMCTCLHEWTRAPIRPIHPPRWVTIPWSGQTNTTRLEISTFLWGTHYKRAPFWSSLQCSSSTQLTHERNTLMNDTKFIGLDVHKTSVSAAVLDQDGKLVMQAGFATHSAAILSFIHRLRR